MLASLSVWMVLLLFRASGQSRQLETRNLSATLLVYQVHNDVF